MPPKKLSFIDTVKNNGTVITFIIGLLSVAITIGVYQNKITTLETKVNNLENEIKTYKDETTAVSSKLEIRKI